MAIHVRIYNPQDLADKNILCDMTCHTCEGKGKIENPVYKAFHHLGFKNMEEFNAATGANLEEAPMQLITCPKCTSGVIEVWFYLSDLEKVINNMILKSSEKLLKTINELEKIQGDRMSRLDERLTAHMYNNHPQEDHPDDRTE